MVMFMVMVMVVVVVVVMMMMMMMAMITGILSNARKLTQTSGQMAIILNHVLS